MSHLLLTAHEFLVHLAQIVPADLGIDDTGAVAPDGVRAKVSTIIAAARWVGGVIAVLGLIGIGITWMINNQRHAAGEKAGALGWWAGGAILLGACITLAGWLIG